jgi:hypothetical protein
VPYLLNSKLFIIADNCTIIDCIDCLLYVDYSTGQDGHFDCLSAIECLLLAEILGFLSG